MPSLVAIPSGFHFFSPRAGESFRIGLTHAFSLFNMNIWGYSEEGVDELALANPEALQALRSLLSKLEKSAARDE